MGFKKAEKKQVKLKLGMTGPSGAGKTFSALKIAKGLLEAQTLGRPMRIALIDTENKSASLYADTKGLPDFDTLELEPPYTVEKYIAAMELAIKEKYDVLIVDSVSHVWSGEGGLLQEKEMMDTRGGNSFTNWAKMTPKWNRFVSAILHSDVHMICTMRSKQEHALSQNDKGKTEVKKMGMAPQVRDGFEYELTAVFDMDTSHHAQVSKDRTGLFDGRIWKPDEKTGAEIWAWLNSGRATSSEPAVPAAPAPHAAPKPAPAAGPVIAPAIAPNILQVRTNAISEVLEPIHWPKGGLLEYCELKYGAKLAHITEPQFAELLETVKTKTYTDVMVDLKAETEKPEAEQSFNGFDARGPVKPKLPQPKVKK